MRSISSPNRFSLNTTSKEAAAEPAENVSRNPGALQSSPPRPVMQQSRSVDSIGMHPLVVPDPVRPISLHSAATAGEIGLMRELIKSGTSVDALDTCGYTPLMDAAYAGRLDAVRLLLKKGANPDIANDYGIQALHIAANKGHSEIVGKLIKRAQSVNQADRFGNTPLIDAIKSRHAATVKALVMAGADPNVVADEGLTALMLSVELSDLSLLELLLQNPALNHIDAVATQGKTALNMAIQKSDRAAVERLLNAGARMDFSCWSLVSDQVISDLLVHRHTLFRPDFVPRLAPDHVLLATPVDCIKKIAVLLGGAIPLQQATLNNALHKMGLSGFIVETILRISTYAGSVATAIAGDGNKPGAAQWSKIFVSMMHFALADPALQTVFHDQGLTPLTTDRMSAIVAQQINALKAAASQTESEMAARFKTDFIQGCLHLTLNDSGGFSGAQVYTLLINQGLHHELAVMLQQAATAAWDRVKKMDKPMQIGALLPGNFLAKAMDAMGQLFENEIRHLLQLEFSTMDNTQQHHRARAATLAPTVTAILTHRHQLDVDMVRRAFGLR